MTCGGVKDIISENRVRSGSGNLKLAASSSMIGSMVLLLLPPMAGGPINWVRKDQLSSSSIS